MSKVERLKKQLLKSEEKVKLHGKTKDLDYDSKLEYEKNKLILEDLPKIIDYIETENLAIEKALEERKNIDSEEEKKIKLEIKEYKIDQKEKLKAEKKKLKEKRKDGLISKKAEKNGKKALKLKYKENIKAPCAPSRRVVS